VKVIVVDVAGVGTVTVTSVSVGSVAVRSTLNGKYEAGIRE